MFSNSLITKENKNNMKGGAYEASYELTKDETKTSSSIAVKGDIIWGRGQIYSISHYECGK